MTYHEKYQRIWSALPWWQRAWSYIWYTVLKRSGPDVVLLDEHVMVRFENNAMRPPDHAVTVLDLNDRTP